LRLLQNQSSYSNSKITLASVARPDNNNSDLKNLQSSLRNSMTFNPEFKGKFNSSAVPELTKIPARISTSVV